MRLCFSELVRFLSFLEALLYLTDESLDSSAMSDSVYMNPMLFSLLFSFLSPFSPAFHLCHSSFFLSCFFLYSYAVFFLLFPLEIHSNYSFMSVAAYLSPNPLVVRELACTLSSALSHSLLLMCGPLTLKSTSSSLDIIFLLLLVSRMVSNTCISCQPHHMHPFAIHFLSLSDGSTLMV